MFEFKSLGDFGVLPKSGRILEDPPKSPSHSCLSYPAHRIVKINHLLSLYLTSASVQGQKKKKKTKKKKDKNNPSYS